ncbi:MAG TPA: helix-turn-helix domain-containing protein [Burkholderiaceae bacterium]
MAIVLPQRLWAGSVFLARDLLLAAGTLGARSENVAASTIFDVRLVGASRNAVACFGGMPIRPEATVAAAGSFDVVIVPAQFAPTGVITAEDRRFATWIASQHRHGATILSLGGAVLLAKSGLLDHREATGLVSERGLLNRHFPRVSYLPSRRILVSDDIITVCGIGPMIDACAHLIERFFGAALARRFLRHTSTEVMPTQEHLALWSARFKRHRDAQVLAAQEIVERELHQVPPLAHIAAQVGLSERSLSRRIVAATGCNLRQYIAELRLELTEFMLRSTDTPMIHVAQRCGFSSASAMSRAFAAHFGKSPGRYRAQARS